MTVEDTVHKTLGLFAILLARHGRRRLDLSMSTVAATGVPTMIPWIVGMLGGFVLALVVMFTSRKKVRPGLIFAYAGFEGLFVGGISAFFEYMWPGVVVRAVLATLAVVGVTLALRERQGARAPRPTRSS